MLAALFAGLGLGLSLIVAIGAQNLFVLRQGIRREHVLPVVIVCAASDAALIALGVSGAGLALSAVPWLIVAVRWAGALFLVGYGLRAARRAWRGESAGMSVPAADDHGSAAASDASSAAAAAARGSAVVQTTPHTASETTPETTSVTTSPLARVPGPPATNLGSTLVTVLALTWLNPHVYLDTVFLLGAVAGTHGEDRWIFAAGAALGSVVWFCALGFGARYLGRWLSTPRAWRLLDAVIAVIMIGLGVGLVIGA